MPHIKPNTDPRRKCLWIADFTPAATPDNPKPTRTRPGFMTKHEAEMEIALRGDGATIPLRAEMTLATVVAWYLLFERNDRRVAPKTVEQYEAVLARLLVPGLAEKPFSQVLPGDLDLVLAPRRGTELSPKTKDEYARIVGRMVAAAMKCGFANVNISGAFVRQNAVHRHPSARRIPGETDFRAVRDAASPQALVAFLLLTTMFIGPDAISRMCWQDVDFEKGTVFLPIGSGNGSEPRPGRLRQLPPELETALMRLRARSFVGCLSDPLIVSPEGKALVPGDVAHLVHGAQVRAGLVAAARRTDGSGKVQGMPRGRFSIAEFVEAAMRDRASTVTSLLILADAVNRSSTESLQRFSRHLKVLSRKAAPAATLGLMA
ncbi:hypothetical protein [Pelagibacterium sp. H642]|uniref:hypothetical protein n=1 Tax=Pelagibacterium sp. H642 TaxID=1881069 RepID=UPI002814E495|nr:hypothetical protein [Pelagibacterium sp. H642]WMT91913.1 site-specific integrase [Pelagibacterium sp. H642]